MHNMAGLDHLVESPSTLAERMAMEDEALQRHMLHRTLLSMDNGSQQVTKAPRVRCHRKPLKRRENVLHQIQREYHRMDTPGLVFPTQRRSIVTQKNAMGRYNTLQGIVEQLPYIWRGKHDAKNQGSGR